MHARAVKAVSSVWGTEKCTMENEWQRNELVQNKVGLSRKDDFIKFIINYVSYQLFQLQNILKHYKHDSSIIWFINFKYFNGIWGK